LTKQQERQDEEFLHCSHFPIIRKHYNDFRDAVKLPKEGAVIRQHRRRHAAYGIAGIIGRKPPAIAANAASCLQFLRVGGGRFALLPAWVTGGDGFSSFHRYTYARVCARVTLRGQVSIDQISDICERLQFHYWGMVRGRGSGRDQSGQDNTVSHPGNICWLEIAADATESRTYRRNWTQYTFESQLSLCPQTARSAHLLGRER
jgi:hypothetical protein